jgi:TPR repeat protein
MGWPAAQLARGRWLMRCGSFRAAFRLIAKAAQAGLPAAWYELGYAYLLGRGVPCAPAVAVCWLIRAANSGEVAAQSLLATLALRGISHAAPGAYLFGAAKPALGGPDYDEALLWARRAAAGGSAEAEALMGFILTTGPPHLRDTDEGAKHYHRAAQAGDPRGQLGWALALLGDLSANAIGDVRELLEAAASGGLSTAHYLLGILAESGVLDSPDFPAAAEHYRAGAERGHRSAQLRYGIALLLGRGVAQDQLNGESWLRRAGLAGEPLASAIVGDLYARGAPLPPNNVEAITWFRRAAEAGHAGAARALGHLYMGVRGVLPDPEEAANWLRYAIDHGDVEARADLARLALMRQVPDSDQRRTFTWFRDRATGGDPAAAFNLGICLAEGIGTPRDEVSALELLRHAAERLVVAQYWYGRLLAEGRGCLPDAVAAREYFLKAAEQHNADAEVAAGEMLINGRGGPPDPDRAMELFRRAAARGHPGGLLALRVLGCQEPVNAQ